MADNRKHDTIQDIALIVLIISVSISISVIFIGVHNIDNGYNMARLQIITGEVFLDQATDGKAYTSVEGYTLGLTQVTMGFLYLTGTLVALGYVIGRKHE